MSTLRIETLRLIWLEAFLAVSEAGNLSGAARTLRVHQSTITRSLQELEAWLGKQLTKDVRIASEHGPQLGRKGARVISIELTPDGAAFCQLARRVVDDLQAFRRQGTAKDALITEMSDLVNLMRQKILNGEVVTDADIFDISLQDFKNKIDRYGVSASILTLKKLHRGLKSFHSTFEEHRLYDKRRQKLSQTTPVPDMPPGWFEEYARAKSGKT